MKTFRDSSARGRSRRSRRSWSSKDQPGGIHRSDNEETDAEIKKLAENYRQSEEEFRQHLRPDDIEYIKYVGYQKTVDFLLENAKLI